MALLLPVVLPKCPSFPQFTNSSKRENALARQVGVPSLRKGSQLTIKCSTGESNAVTRNDFPIDFKFGASTSALQTEGFAHEGGRGSSTWDSFIGTTIPATDSYHKYKEDVQLLKNMGVDVYRFSIAWPRILPHGSLRGGINQEGVDFYNNLINELKENGIEPFVTLFHFDLPTALQDEYNGFLSTKLVDDFKDYADICFKKFGDRVKHWATFNEPQVFSQYGYKTGMSGPDNPALYPYIAAHNIILAHATVAKLYRETYQDTQSGEIGMSLSAEWYLPFSESPQDKNAVLRAWDFTVGWYLEPLLVGDYPFSMKAIVRDRLPTFKDEEMEMVKGSIDFVGINYYTSRYAQGLTFSANDIPVSYAKDQYVKTRVQKDGKLIGPKAQGKALIFVYPQGLADILSYLKFTYNNPKIYITENGYPQKIDSKFPIATALQDDVRIDFIKDHLDAVRQALKKEVNVNGYFIWALLDCMEMGMDTSSDYDVRFGLNYTDYLHDLKRYPKKSAEWLKNFLKNESNDDVAFSSPAYTAGNGVLNKEKVTSS